MGEQGAESIHALMMKLERNFQSIPNELDRLKYFVKEQALATAPSLLTLRPPIKKRKVGESSDEDDEEQENSSLVHPMPS